MRKDLSEIINNVLIEMTCFQEKTLCETITKSYDLDFMISHLYKNNFINGYIDFIKKKGNNDVCKLFTFGSKGNIKGILQIIERTYGWHGSQIIICKINETNSLKQAKEEFQRNNEEYIGKYKEIVNEGFYGCLIELRKKYTSKIEKLGIKLPEFIYHIAPTKYIPKIKRIGLIPISKNNLMEYPSRVYFSLDERSLEDLYFMPEFKKDKFNSLLTISTKGIENLNWYNDDDSAQAIFTTENIHPKQIVKIEKMLY